MTVVLLIIAFVFFIAVSGVCAKKWSENKLYLAAPLVCGLLLEGLITLVLHKDFNWVASIIFCGLNYFIAWFEIRRK